MSFLSGLKSLFRKKPILERNYAELLSIAGQNRDWALRGIGEDADIHQNIWSLRERSRSLFKTDVYFQKYTEELFANVFGEGIRLRMRIKETEDRVVYAADEKAAIQRHWNRIEKVRKWAAKKLQREYAPIRDARAFEAAFTRGIAKVQVGELDVFANQLIERKWREWQRKEFCTTSKKFTYNEVRQHRLLQCARDGDVFIQLVKKPSGQLNKFGFAIKLISAEWCPHNLNIAELPSGNEIRMGIEFDGDEPVAYYFAKRRPGIWRWGSYGNYVGTSSTSPDDYERIPAAEIIHYARFKDSDTSRGVPWCASVIPKSRHLDKYEEAEVIAARLAACKLGWFYSTMMPEGGTIGAGIPNLTDPQACPQNGMEASPGSFQGLPFGVEFKEWNPNHPNGNFDLFRKGMLRSWCAGLPGANYNIIANDLEGVNYSSGRLGMLDERELWKLIQQFDIDTAEVPIFEAWLEMALMTGEIPLPFSKIDKFNKPHFQGRRWAWVDPMKEVQAHALEIAHKLTSRTRIHDELGTDFEEILFELAEEQALMEDLGMDDESAGLEFPMPAEEPENMEEEDRPASSNGNGKHARV